MPSFSAFAKYNRPYNKVQHDISCHATDIHIVHALQVTLAAISDCLSEEVSCHSLKYLISLFTTRV